MEGREKIVGEPIDQCGCRLVRTANGLHMQECSLHKAALKLLEACKCASDFYQNNFDTMPVSFQGVANILEAAITEANHD